MSDASAFRNWVHTGPSLAKRRRLYLLIVVLALVGVPFLNGGALYLLSINVLEVPPNVSRQAVVQQFLWTKVLVDGVLSVLLLVFITDAYRREQFTVPNFPILLLFFVFVTLAAIVTGMKSPGRLLVGFRYFSAILLFFVSLSSFSERDLETIGRAVIILTTVAAILGLVQYVLSGAIRTGRVGELYGIYSVFSYPSTFASVLGLGSVFVVVDRGLSGWTKALLLILFFLSVLLSQSGTGIAVFGVILAVWLYRRHSVGATAIGALAVIGAIPVLTRRGDIWSSLIVRVSIFVEYLETFPVVTVLFGKGIGFGTDTAAFLIDAGYIAGTVFEADSFYTAMLLQVGLVGLGLFLIVNARFLFISLRDDSWTATVAMYVIPLVLAISVTRNSFELFPVNWVYWIVCGVLLSSHTGLSPIKRR